MAWSGCTPRGRSGARFELEMVTGSVIHNIDLHHTPLLAAMSKPPEDLAESAGGAQITSEPLSFCFWAQGNPVPINTLVCAEMFDLDAPDRFH